MIDEMLTFLARAPTLGDLSLTWGQAGPRLGTGGVYLRGVKVLQTKTDLLGCQKQRAVRNFCCGSACRCQQGTPTPPCKTPAAWRHCRRGSRPKAPQARASAGQLRTLTEQVCTEGGQLDRADPGGTALYSIRVTAEYTMRYDT